MLPAFRQGHELIVHTILCIATEVVVRYQARISDLVVVRYPIGSVVAP
jgi:hypothetical protein